MITVDVANDACGVGFVEILTTETGTHYAGQTIICVRDNPPSDNTECANVLGAPDTLETGDFKRVDDVAEFKMQGNSDAGSTVIVDFTVFDNDAFVNIAVSSDGASYTSVADITNADVNASLDYTFSAPVNFEYIRISHNGDDNKKFRLDAIISNYSNLVATCFKDSDNDGIDEETDLDDDNDGILDTDELGILDCTTGVSPLFGAAQGPNNYLGSDINNPAVGDSFLYTNVYAGVDAIITIVSSTDTAIVNLDITTTGLDENFQPQINHIDNNSFTEFRIDFVLTGTSTPAPGNNFVVTTIDNDVNEFVVYADGHTSNLYVDSPTEELIYSGAAISAGFSEGYISNGNVITGIPVDAPRISCGWSLFCS